MQTKLKTKIKNKRLKDKFSKINFKNLLIGVALVLLIILIIFLTFKVRDYVADRKEEYQVTSFLQQQRDIDSQDKKEEDSKQDNQNFDYVAVLEIPSINFEHGFYDLGSKNNTVDVGLEVIKGSSLPDKENSQLVIAGHSGSGRLALFEKLDKVKKGNKINIYYDGYKYIYTMIDSQVNKKNGKITVETDINSTTLILTTCNPSNDKKEQLTLIAELTKKEKI